LDFANELSPSGLTLNGVKRNVELDDPLVTLSIFCR